eukprot:6595337-Pyramimonas_sp.AAC.1
MFVPSRAAAAARLTSRRMRYPAQPQPFPEAFAAGFTDAWRHPCRSSRHALRQCNGRAQRPVGHFHDSTVQTLLTPSRMCRHGHPARRAPSGLQCDRSSDR